MADKKLTVATLRKMLAKQTGMPESKVETFLDSFFPTIVNGLKEDGQVRLNGFGTFKMQSVKPRKSVNVKTGESIIIDGYNKVVFTAEPAVKEQANADNPNFKPVKLSGKAAPAVAADGIDPLQKLGEQAEEIKDILAELGVSTGIEEVTTDAGQVEVNPQPEQPEPETEEVQEPQAEEYEPKEVVPMTVPPIETEPEKPEEEPVTKNEPEAEPEKTEVPQTGKQAEQTEPQPEKKKEKPFKPWKVAGITILIFCLLLVCAYFFLRHKLTTWADSMLDKNNKTENTVAPAEPETEPEDTTPIVADNAEDTSAEEVTEETVAEQEKDGMQQWYGETRTYTEFIKVETLTEGSRLSHLSRKYYGAPDFWVYIYEANKDRIKNPNRIGQGTKLRIPVLPDELTDTSNEKAMQQAKELHNKILGKK